MVFNVTFNIISIISQWVFILVSICIVFNASFNISSIISRPLMGNFTSAGKVIVTPAVQSKCYKMALLTILYDEDDYYYYFIIIIITIIIKEFSDYFRLILMGNPVR